MANANEQLDLFTREQKVCSVCQKGFWGWRNDKKCILCLSPMEDAIADGAMLKEQVGGD